MREKYIDEAVGIFFVFGQRPDGAVDVSDGQRDVFTNLAPATAAAVVEAQREFREKLYVILQEK